MLIFFFVQVALSVGHLASLYNYDMEQYNKVSWFVLNFFYWPKKIAQNVLHFSNALLSNYQIYQAEQLYLCSIQKY